MKKGTDFRYYQPVKPACALTGLKKFFILEHATTPP